jgi:sarcosine/dimethylglycine N-methyltransferase
MPLYATIDRIRHELGELALDEPLSAEAFYAFDQFHYEGTEAVARAARSIGLRRGDRVLEIGSGIGGPARYLAHTVGCHVTAVELQHELHEIGSDLTRRSGLSGLVTHVEGDALTVPLPDAHFDAVVSWLAVHHIPERPRLFTRAAAALKHGGRLYVEDLHEKAPFAPPDLHDVQHTLIGTTMTGADAYDRELCDAGFTDVQITDMTAPWARFTAERTRTWRAQRERHERVLGPVHYATLDRFFATMQRLFESGSLGGIIVTASRGVS